MKDFIIILLLAAVLICAIILTVRRRKKGSACCGTPAETLKRIPVADKNKSHYPHTVRLHITGMTCENCAIRVENALNKVDGVWAKVDKASGIADIRMKEQIELKTICKLVAEVGYHAEKM